MLFALLLCDISIIQNKSSDHNNCLFSPPVQPVPPLVPPAIRNLLDFFGVPYKCSATLSDKQFPNISFPHPSPSPLRLLLRCPLLRCPLLKLGLNGGDETVAFGPSVSTGSALFHIETLATVGPSAPPTSVPTVFASASEEGVTVAVGSQVHVLDGRCSSLLSPSLDFESSAENVSWSEDGTFVAIATSSGAVHFLDVTVGKVIHSQNLGQGRAAKGKAAFAALEFSAADAEGNYSMIALMSSGVLIYFTGINLSKLRAAIAGEHFLHVQLAFFSAKFLSIVVSQTSVERRRRHALSPPQSHFFIILIRILILILILILITLSSSSCSILCIFKHPLRVFFQPHDHQPKT